MSIWRLYGNQSEPITKVLMQIKPKSRSKQDQKLPRHYGLQLWLYVTVCCYKVSDTWHKMLDTFKLRHTLRNLYIKTVFIVRPYFTQMNDLQVSLLLVFWTFFLVFLLNLTVISDNLRLSQFIWIEMTIDGFDRLVINRVNPEEWGRKVFLNLVYNIYYATINGSDEQKKSKRFKNL